ncbi:MAG: ribonuclease P protein component [Magnetospirillum gryphiswaldense]|nr:ribonuclease P protein component [Magnetospirillum gryphiswaldense]
MPVSLARLKKRADFLRVAGLRKKWASPGLILQVAPLPEGGSARKADAIRIGFTCSKKVGNAVARNRARRRLKAAVDAVFPASARLGLDYVVIGRRETVGRDYSLLLQDLRTALKRVGALAATGEPEPQAPSGEGQPA